CQAFITIPTAEYAYINLAQAANIMCSESFQSHAGGSAETGPAPELTARDQLEGTYGQPMAPLRLIGYSEANRASGEQHIYRRLSDRAGLTAHEVAALRGLWAQMRCAANQPPERVPGNRPIKPG